MKNIYKSLTILLVALTVSCGGNKKVAEKRAESSRDERREVVHRSPEAARPAESPRTSAPAAYTDKVAEYIRIYAPIAQEEMELYRIPASITLAQGILESGAGNSELTRKANNHFGIKCHGWQGGEVYHDDDRSQECFRKYNDARYSFRDHSLFLTERKRYAALFELDPSDYRGWAKGLRAAGYATDRKYPDKLISLIERYELYRYDNKGGRAAAVAYSENNPTGTEYIVKKGDTLYSIAKRYNLSVEELKQLNNLTSNAIGIGQRLYVTR